MTQNSGGPRSEYPAALADAERAAVTRRREAAGFEPADVRDKPLVGVALSGGGIRSATFCLGVFQGLARMGLLKDIDHLSTVSGGGYFGAFLGRLFTREENVPPGAATAAVEAKLKAHDSEPVRWLRENGRYLAPNGAGDARVALAVVLRNWCALQLVLAVFLLMVFLAAAAVRQALWSWDTWRTYVETPLVERAASPLWWSPFLLVPLATFVLAVVPLGWGYWLTQRGRSVSSWMPLACTMLALVAAAVALSVLPPGGRGWWWTALGVAASSILAVILWLAAMKHSHALGAAPQPELARNRLSRALGTAVIVALGALGVGLIDSLAQSIYAVLATPDGHAGALFASIAASMAPLIAGAKALVGRFGGGNGKQGRPVALPASVLAGVAAFLIVVIGLTSLAVAGHAILWGGATPKGDPGARILANYSPPPPRVDLSPDRHVVVNAPAAAQVIDPGHDPASAVWAAFGAALLLCLLAGRTFSFLNLSSHQQFYGSRLVRAYLGASNPGRRDGQGMRISDVIPGDDIAFAKYRPHETGGPLHLINVTVNETVDGRSEIEQRDRKGLIMALGACGMSVGLRHHALWAPEAPEEPGAKGRTPRRYEVAIQPVPREGGGFQVFPSARGPEGSRPLTVEALNTGNWVGISGAAFSTGLGARTSIGLSLLAGFANVRLGYWWDSRIDPGSRAGVAPRSWFGSAFAVATRVFSVQIQFIEEFLARFHGTARRRWYLTDGGHFENTACHELLRRRVPFILCCDDGADPDYDFQDVANLVRTARIDLCAEIRFLDEEELKAVVDPSILRYVGTIQELRRPRRGAAAAAGDKPGRFKGSRYSTKHAAMARVFYDGSDQAGSVIVFLKPSVTGDEPLDVLEYHRTHEAFPQEPTSDQFFDQAQWESYRKLGEHVAESVFAKVPDTAMWTPARMTIV